MLHVPQRFALLAATATLSLGLTAAPALAVHAGHWVHDSEADFTAGQTQDAVVTNLGDVKLAAQSSVIGQMPEETTIIHDMQTLTDGSLYIAAGPQGTLLIRKGDKIEPLLKLEKEQIFCLETNAKGQLILGISGEKSRLAVLQKDNTLKTLVDLPDTRYIWDVKLKGNHAFLATGTQGKLLQVDLTKTDKPVITELLDAAQANILCLTIDNQGRIFAGTDTDGLVYRITLDAQGKATPFVVYDAAEPEIGALWLAPDDTLYVGTADAEQARPGRLEAASQGGQGRPAVEESTDGPKLNPNEKPQPPADAPKPGDIPQLPPQPKPIEPPKPDQKPSNDDKATDVTQPVIIPADPAKIKHNARVIVLADTSVLGSMQIDARTDQPVAMQTDSVKAATDKKGGDAAAAASVPTTAQRDELRAVIQQRLQQARQSGALQTSPGGGQRTASRPRGGAPGAPQTTTFNRGATKPGNAVYSINPQGFVSEIFRESVMILNITGLPDGALLIATGSEGRLYRVDPASSEITRLVKLEPQQITTILAGPDGDLLLGTANPATLARFSPQFAKEGTFTSVVLDASQISLFGQISIVAHLPQGTRVEVQTRSGNVSDPEKGPWSEWSQAVSLAADDQLDPLTPRGMAVDSPPARFLQYQLTLKSNQGKSPQVDKVDASFVVPNLKPSIASVAVQVPGAAQAGARGGSDPSQPQQIARVAQGQGAANQQAVNAPPVMNVTWEASDPNNDSLLYTLEYRPANAQVWLPLAKEVSENRYDWQTRRVPDGRYILRVTATDAADNTTDSTLTDSRTSDPILVDNTPPELLTIKTTPGKGQLIITGRARDALSVVTGLQYVVDAGEQWKYILPDDLIYDSTDESFTVKILDLAPGQHVITLRADDARGNAVHEALIVEIK